MSEPIHPLQAMINGMGAAMQKDRAKTQLTLGRLIEILAAWPPERLIVGIGGEASYRGYYCDLAFEPSTKPEPVASVLQRCRAAMGQVYEGYKGGDFTMGANTPLWIAQWGACGDKLTGLDTTVDPIMPVTVPDEE